ncbi:carboxypeptidase N subunit 2-like isoform X2 [Mizuhopecten yessoensis]|uniref:carboxypeptidase N subunit 2-like isoform X2 n=1 Tax=Mizuhopecten yessoensis TaxID=6573 RepID=UPI000B4591D2|nr:carboxypeptidase N subunit 2-like isoform X2 [Mizuhopecten yessoensis]
MLFLRLVSGVLCLLLALPMSNATPTGCTETGSYGTCDFSSWSPPLVSGDFSTSPCYITLNNVDGTLPANAFSGLSDCADPSGQRSIAITCTGSNVLVIAANAFAGTMTWITELSITDCVISAGISSSDLSGLSGVVDFLTSGGTIASFAATTFSGLPMNSIAMSGTTLTAATFPSGFLENAGSAMTKITLDNLGLTSIPSGAFDGKSAVTALNVANNALTTLETNAFDSMTSLSTLSITGNQWACTCDISYLVKWVKYTGVTLDGDITCMTPTAYNGTLLNKVSFALGCETTTTASTDDSTWDKALKYGTAVIATLALGVAIATMVSHCCMMQKMAQGGNSPNTSNQKTKNSKRIVTPLPVNEPTRNNFF